MKGRMESAGLFEQFLSSEAQHTVPAIENSKYICGEDAQTEAQPV